MRLSTPRAVLFAALSLCVVATAANAPDASAVGLRPVVTSISPSKGRLQGATTVTVSGENFTGASAVKFGSENATSFTVNSETSITAVSPAGPAGSVDVTVSNPLFTSATSSSDQFTYQLPPTNVSPPTITGTAQQGQTLTEVHGSWTNEPSGFTYQWLQCNAAGEECVPIPGTGQTWAPFPGDVGHTLKVLETAGNAGGTSEPAASPATALVTPEPERTGNVAAWGGGNQYELGAGWMDSFSDERGVPWPLGSNVTGALQVASGFHSSFALMPNGTVDSWGGDGAYQLGHGWRPKIEEGGIVYEPPPSETEGRGEARSPGARPVVGSDWTPTHRTILEGVAAIEAQLALLANGEVRTWGTYYGGKLGNGTDGGLEHAEESSTRPVSPTLGAGGPNLAGIKAVAAGGDTRLAITSEGKVYGWGRNFGSMLGPLAQDVLYPTEIQGVSNAQQVALSSTGVDQGHSLFLIKKPSGETEILALGSNKYGELGNSGAADPSVTPVPVLKGGAVLRHIVAIAATNEASFALVEPRPDEREVLAWGRNNEGQLGIGSISSESREPVRVLGPNGEANFPQPITELHADKVGKYQGFGMVIAAGKLFAWGGNEVGELGDGSEAAKPTPVEVKQWDGTPLPSRVLSVAGGEHILALLEGALPPHMLTATLENKGAPSEQITFTWQTPGNANVQLRIEATESIERWDPTLTYNAGEKVEDGGTNPNTGAKELVLWKALAQNAGKKPSENPTLWESKWQNKTIQARKLPVVKPGLAQRSAVQPLPPGPVNNPFYEVRVKEEGGGPGIWLEKKVNTQWMH